MYQLTYQRRYLGDNILSLHHTGALFYTRQKYELCIFCHLPPSCSNTDSMRANLAIPTDWVACLLPWWQAEPCHSHNATQPIRLPSDIKKVLRIWRCKDQWNETSRKHRSKSERNLISTPSKTILKRISWTDQHVIWQN